MVDKDKLIGIAMVLIIACTFLAVFFYVNDALETQSRDTTVTVNSETLTLVGNSTDGGPTFVLNNSGNITCYGEFTLVSAVNATTPRALISAGNYTTLSGSGRVIAVDNSSYQYTNWIVNYTYKTGQDACSGISTTTAVGTTTAGWFNIIIIAAVAGLIFLIIFKMVYNRGGASTQM